MITGTLGLGHPDDRGLRLRATLTGQVPYKCSAGREGQSAHRETKLAKYAEGADSSA